MARKTKSEKPQESGASPAGATAPSSGVDDALQPFQEASTKFLAARREAHESALAQQAQAWLDLQQKVWEVEREAQNALLEATKAHFERLGGSQAGEVGGSQAGEEGQGLAHAQAQLDYEIKARQVDFDVQTKLRSIAESAYTDQGNDVARQFGRQQQEAYQTYLADLQQAWSGAKTLDPQSTSAIASHIMCALNGAI